MRALGLDGVHHAFRGRVALEGLSLRVEPGEVVALVGLNGAGKTTALRILAGRLRPDAGTAAVRGHDPLTLPLSVAARFGHLVEAPLVYPELTVTENLVSASRLHGMDRATAIVAARDAVDRFVLERWEKARARTLSMGNRQRLGIACASVHAPAALVFDEPTNSLDPAGVVIVRDLIQSLAAGGAAVLVSSHHLDEVSRIADRIEVVHAGRVIGALEPGGVDIERRFFAMLLAADASTGAVR